MAWAVCERDVHRTLIGSAQLPAALGAWHAMPSPREQVQGLLLRSGLIFGPPAARKCAECGLGSWDPRALEVFGEWSTSAEVVVQDPGGDF